MADTFVKFGETSSQHLTTEFNMRKNTMKGSNASVVLEEPSQEDMMNERPSLANKASTRSAGRSTMRKPSNNSYSPSRSANSRGRGMSNQRSQESYRVSGNIGVFSSTGVSNNQFPVKPMHPIDSMNNFSNRSTKRSPERSPTHVPNYAVPRTAESRGDTVSSYNPFSMTHINEKDSVRPQNREGY